MDKIKWCINKNKGIKLIKPSNNLRDAYLVKAENALDALRTSKSREWQLTAAYYTIYHGLYSLLMKLGIKCEIHSCTIEFAKVFLSKYFTSEDYKLIDKAFSARIDSQYYVDKKVPDKKYNIIVKRTPLFLVKCKNIVVEQKEIAYIRTKFFKIM